MEGYIHSIESCGTVDGPGLRYVVFFQGCPMRCQYCHNPDTWAFRQGQKMTVTQVLNGFYDNRPFYKSGGVTVTGGEPLMQMEFLITLFRNLKKQNVHTCIDTSGILFNEDNTVFMKQLTELLPLTDLVLLDIKHMDEERHRALTGHSNKQVLAFAHYLDKHNIPIWVRHVIVPGISFYQEYLEQLGTFMSTLHNVKALDVLPYHSMGREKYAQLHMEYPLPATPEPTTEDAVSAKELILSAYKKARTS